MSNTAFSKHHHILTTNLPVFIVPKTVPFEDIKVGYYYLTKEYDRETDRNLAHRMLQLVMPRSSKAMFKPHIALVIAKNPEFRIVRFMTVSTLGGQTPADFTRSRGWHPAVARRYLPMGWNTKPSFPNMLRGVSYPTIVKGYLRFNVVHTTQYNMHNPETELVQLIQHPVYSPPWMLSYANDLHRAWQDTMYGGEGYEIAIPIWEERMSTIVKQYTPQSKEYSLQVAEAERKAHERQQAERLEQLKVKQKEASKRVQCRRVAGEPKPRKRIAMTKVAAHKAKAKKMFQEIKKAKAAAAAAEAEAEAARQRKVEKFVEANRVAMTPPPLPPSDLKSKNGRFKFGAFIDIDPHRDEEDW